jgi:hypothetical protein
VTSIEGSGLAVDVPSGWEGRIYDRGAPAFGPLTAGQQGSAPSLATLHVASFPLPATVGDYGGGAVELMTNKDLLVVLMEFTPSSAATPLFAAKGIPRLRVDDVSPTQLQRLIEGQGGVQRFFSAAGRAFCLYVVFGSYARRTRTIPVVNDILGSLTIS